MRESSGRIVGRGRRPGSKYLKRWDMYGHVPTYDLPAFTSWLGVAATFVTVLLFLAYMVITTVQYIRKPPELVLQGTRNVTGQSFAAPSFMGFWVKYTDANGDEKYVMPSANTDYFSIEASHVVHQSNLPRTNTPLSLKECNLPSNDNVILVCIDHGAVDDELEGDFTDDTYKYINVKVRACRNSTALVSSGINCATEENIQAAIQSRVTVGAVLYVQNFETEKDKAGEEESLSLSVVSDRWYLLPGLEVKNEVFLLGRYIQHENPFFGSPPYPETETRLLDFEKFESRLAPADNGVEVNFYVRLSHKISLEETSYWMPSLLDLFGAWGAMASFLTTLSLGLVARKYNQKSADRSFRTKLASLGDGEHDLRLYEREHFDEHGRLILTANELNNPTTAYGELRNYASREHTRKKRAINKIRSLLHSRIVGRAAENDESLQPLIM